MHYWKDSTQTAKDNPGLLPLSTSYDNTLYADSCAYYTGSQFSTDGNIYVTKGKHCGCNANPPCLSSYLGSGFPVTQTPNWYLKVNDTRIYYGSHGFTIILLNNNYFSYYEYQTYNFTKTLVKVYVYKSYTDW